MSQDITSNSAQFAARGDEWGAFDPPQRPRRYKRKRHPDGFTEYTLVEDESEAPGPTGWKAPYVPPAIERIRNLEDRKRKAANLLLVRKQPQLPKNDQPREKRVPFVPHVPKKVDTRSQREIREAESMRAQRRLDDWKCETYKKLWRVAGYEFSDEQRIEIDRLFGSFDLFEAEAERDRNA